MIIVHTGCKTIDFVLFDIFIIAFFLCDGCEHDELFTKNTQMMISLLTALLCVAPFNIDHKHFLE